MIVWNQTIRIFHFLLIISIVSAFLTEDFEKIHEVIGFFVLFLILFRLFYGIFTKNRFAKLSEFFHSPKAIFRFSKSVLTFKEERHLGHNPLAGIVMFSIFTLLFVIIFSGSLGFAMKEEEGIMTLFVEANFQIGKTLLYIHHISTNLLLALIGLHLTGVLVSSILTKENLAKSIFFDGKKRDEK
jgi:cytochrome b